MRTLGAVALILLLEVFDTRHHFSSRRAALLFHFVDRFQRLIDRQSVFVNDGEAVERSLPGVDRHGPFLRDVAQRQVDPHKCVRYLARLKK